MATLKDLLALQQHNTTDLLELSRSIFAVDEVDHWKGTHTLIVRNPPQLHARWRLHNVLYQWHPPCSIWMREHVVMPLVQSAGMDSSALQVRGSIHLLDVFSESESEELGDALDGISEHVGQTAESLPPMEGKMLAIWYANTYCGKSYLRTKSPQTEIDEWSCVLGDDPQLYLSHLSPYVAWLVVSMAIDAVCGVHGVECAWATRIVDAEAYYARLLFE